jgi:carbohydrate diacid regulator
MLLTPDLAEEIVRETMERVGCNINIMDASGNIMASGDPARVGTRHEAAAEAVRRNETITVDESNAAQYAGAQTGVNIPIRFGHRTIGAIGITGRPQEVEPMGQLLKMTTELMIRQSEWKRQAERRQQEIDLVLEALLHRGEAARDADGMVRRLQSLQLPWEPPFAAAVVACSLSDSVRSRESLLSAMCEAVGGDRAILGNDGPQRFVLVLTGADADSSERSLRRLSEWMEAEGIIGCIAVGNRAASLAAIRASFEEADMALRFAGAERTGVVRFDDIEARALASLIPREHGERLWQKLAPVWNPKMAETIRHYCAANLSIARAAESLGIHRNTMLYRLEQIASLTGYDPKRFEHAMLLRIALWQQPEADGGAASPDDP